jgi:hypothetical protein
LVSELESVEVKPKAAVENPSGVANRKIQVVE